MQIRLTIELCCGIIALLGLPGCGSDANLRQRFDSYLAASNAHDIETLRSMTSNEIVWRLGPYVFSGKDEAMLPHEGDAVMRTTLEVHDVRIDGRVVECTLIERNDQIAAVGMPEWRHHARYVFDDQGRVVLKEPWKASPDDAEVARRLRPFRMWIRANHPESVPNFEDVAEVFGAAPARRMRELMQEWIAAGRPGMIDEGAAVVSPPR
ncbi:MAG: nuclear transport factor 2 family protein [Phycisphaeraceae bacterium]|nr:nuclear transport factor 2 family protein [Phycisphaeraceae bacterium]MCB9847519.1 nuclear transport factor 2 family protein [Phycisphaeraceae bacterium]